DGVAGGVERFDDMSDAQRDGDAGAPIKPTEAVKVAVQRQAGNDAQGIWVGEGGAVPVEIGKDVEAPGEGEAFGLTQFHDAGADGFVQFCGGLATGAVPFDDVVEEGARGGLPSL